MHIRQVSAVLDQKLAQLDQQLKQYEAQRAQQQTSAPNAQLDQDILALQQMRAKLIKSKDLAWRAHQLQHQTDEHSKTRQRVIGLSLCTLSVMGAGILLYWALHQ